jgi:NAD(P)H-dependent FMN reductase
MSPELVVLLGSVKSDRQGIGAARYIIRQIKRHRQQAMLVDPLEINDPLLDMMHKEYPRGLVPALPEGLAELYRGADGFVIVTVKYNQCTPAALKNLPGCFLEEFWRPSAMSRYSAGRFGGIRAGVALRTILPSILAIRMIVSSLSEYGTANEAWIDKAAARFPSEIEQYSDDPHRLELWRQGWCHEFYHHYFSRPGELP